MAAKDALGQYGERVAVRHLQEAGYEVLARNWRCAHGELDVVAAREDVLAFVEVKTRSGVAYGLPAEAISEAKAQRLRELATAWVAACQPSQTCLRFDLVSVLHQQKGPALVEHLEGVLS